MSQLATREVKTANVYLGPKETYAQLMSKRAIKRQEAIKSGSVPTLADAFVPELPTTTRSLLGVSDSDDDIDNASDQ
jgi:hypothetical protein